MSRLRDAVVSGLIAMVFGIVATLVLSVFVPPPLDLPLLVALTAVTTFLVGAVGGQMMDQTG
jgi:hypothetical protein